MGFNGKSLILVGTILFIFQIANFFSIEIITPELERAQVLAAIASLIIILIGFLFKQFEPLAGEKADLNGENRFYITQAIDYDQPADGGATGHLYIDNPLANDSFSVTAMGQFGYRNTSDVWSSVQFAGKYSGSSPRYGFKLYGSSNVEYADITVYGVTP